MISGKKAAKSAPKASPSTTSAKATPNTVLRELLSASGFSMSGPPSATCSRGPAAACAVVMTRCTAVPGRFCDCSSKVTVANATVPSLLTCDAPALVKGLATDCTWGRVPTTCNMRCALASRGPSRSVPDVACRTIWSELPEAAGKSACRSFSAVAEGELGSCI